MTGEDIISSFRGNYNRKSKTSPNNMTDCLIVLTTEKLFVDSEKKKSFDKLFLSNVLSVEHAKGKNKIKIFYSSRSSEAEDVITIEVFKQKGEKKENFDDRIEEIVQNIEVFYESAESKESSEGEPGTSIIPDLIIKPSSPMGVPFSKDQPKPRPKKIARHKPTPKPMLEPTKPTPKPVASPRFCHNCGTALPEGGLFCANCGTHVEK